MVSAHTMIGRAAPPLTLPSTPDGKPYALPIGQKAIALYFFPKANTYGCTKEACAFRDAAATNPTFKKHDGVDFEIVGISADDTTKQSKFIDDHNLGHIILSDAKGEGRKAYGVSTVMMGLVPGRETFFIGKDGVVKDVCTKAMDWLAHTKMVEACLINEEAPPAPK